MRENPKAPNIAYLQASQAITWGETVYTHFDNSTTVGSELDPYIVFVWRFPEDICGTCAILLGMASPASRTFLIAPKTKLSPVWG